MTESDELFGSNVDKGVWTGFRDFYRPKSSGTRVWVRPCPMFSDFDSSSGSFTLGSVTKSIKGGYVQQWVQAIVTVKDGKCLYMLFQRKLSSQGSFLLLYFYPGLPGPLIPPVEFGQFFAAHKP